MRRVLVIAYYFPPFGGAGVQRTLKFVKYLPEFGWQPVVLTVKEQVAHLRDLSLEEDIPSSTPIHRTLAVLPPPWLPWRLRNFVSRWLLLVDEQLGWLPFAVTRGKQLVRQGGIQAIYTTSTPYTDHLIGYLLKQQTRLPWAADFRDPWVDNPVLAFASRVHRRLAGQLEQRVFHTADQIIVNTEPACELYRRKYSRLDSGRLITIPNGYDPADFVQGVALPPGDPTRFKVVHVGSLYGRRRTSRSFFQALQHMFDTGGLPRDRIEVLFVGNAGKETEELVKAYGMADIVNLIGYVPHRQSVLRLLGADLLLLIPTSGSGSEVFLPAKIFEYLAAGKPILAIASPGAAADLVREAQAGVVVDPEEVGEIAAQITVLYQQWERGELNITGNRGVVARYERYHLTGQLARVLDRIAG
jgi:glycosyltransferase involved in cell wall biosynthesis